VEVDGGYHRQRVTADARRTRVLERLGFRVLAREKTARDSGIREEVQRLLIVDAGLAQYIRHAGESRTV
jgi:very-short-patch-repair endonuclease